MDLHVALVNILGDSNPIHVYFQPPGNISIEYPAVIYYRTKYKQKYANNKVYNRKTIYNITVIDKDPESEIVKKLLDWPKCSFDRPYTKDNLHHSVFNLEI